VDSQISNLARQAATGDYAAAKRLIDVLKRANKLERPDSPEARLEYYFIQAMAYLDMAINQMGNDPDDQSDEQQELMRIVEEVEDIMRMVV
jgi:hypothetical protein